MSQSALELFSIVLGFSRTLLSGLAMVALGTFAVLMEPRLFGYIVDEALIPKKGEVLLWGGLLFTFLTGLRVFANLRQAYYFELLGQKVTGRLRVLVFSRLQSLPVSVYDSTQVGRLLTRATNDISALAELFSSGFLTILSNILMVLGILIWMLVLDFRLGLWVAGVFPALVFVSVGFSRSLRLAYQSSRERLSAVNSFLAENFFGMKTIHLFNRQAEQLKRFEVLNAGYLNAQEMGVRVFALFQPTITLAAGISIAAAIYWGGLSSSLGQIKLGILVTYFTLASALFQPVREIADKWNTFLSALASAERIFSVLHLESEFDHAQASVPAQRLDRFPAICSQDRRGSLEGHLRFEGVWFAYPDSPKDTPRWALRAFDLEIFPGEKVAVVGPTGAGKTTLVSLLLRFYEPTRGRILLDGQDLRSYDVRSLRASIGWVQQEVFLFAGSFLDNLTFWESSPPEEAERQVHSLLEGLGMKWDPLKSVQEGAYNFSMGERQVLAFGRALLQNPKILILDEATAHLDPRSESQLHRIYQGATQGRTTLMIAHRLSTVRDADRILVLERGELVESGDHGALIQKDGLYSKLVREDLLVSFSSVSS
jgi:ATP-binding cassette subfamily B multidrug efflux pump